MAGPGGLKRMKELQRLDRRREKDERKRLRQQEKRDRGPQDGEDPDIAGMVPGPQPVPEESAS